MVRRYLVGFVFLAACVGTGDETVIIVQNQTPGDGCVMSGAQTDSFVSAGIIDTSSTTGYLFTPLVHNYASAATDAEARRHIAFTKGAHVDLHFRSDTALDAKYRTGEYAALTHFDTLFAGPIDPDGFAQFSFEIIPAELIHALLANGDVSNPGGTAADLRQVLSADVTIYGTLNNASFETQTFSYPVTVCEGCVAVDLGACNTLDSSFTPTHTGGICNLYQDVQVDCCSTDTGLVCPAVGTLTALQ